MGKYSSLAVRDKYGNIIGYKSTTTDEMVEWTGAASPEFQRIMAVSYSSSPQIKEYIEKQYKRDQIQFYVENPDFLEIV